MEKLKRIFLVCLLTIIFLSVNISAAFTDTTIEYPTVPFFTGAYYNFSEYSVDNQFGRCYKQSNNMLMRLYPGYVSYFGFLTTNLQSGKLYKWQITFGDKLLSDTSQQVGDIENTNTSKLLLLEPDTFEGAVLDSFYDDNTYYTDEYPLYFTGNTYSIPNTAYKMFYDNNTRTMTCIMILPDNFFDQIESYQNHAYIVQTFGTTNAEVNLSINVNMSIPLYVEGDYTKILNEISAKLNNIGAGGITPEQVEEAMISALQQHDQQQESELNSAIQEGKDQIEDVLTPYFPESQKFYLTQTINTIKNDLLGYTGTQCVIKFPKATNPLAQNAVLWDEKQIDIAAAYRSLPGNLRVIISALIDISVALAIFLQAMSLIYNLIIKPGSGGIDDG